MARTVDGRLAYADLLRVLATIAVVVLHISAAWLGQTTVGSTEFNVLCTYDSLMRWCVPMFIMLSGAFLLDPKKTVRLRDIFLKYILRVVIALLVWGTLYALYTYGRDGWHITWAGVKTALHHVLWADTNYHLWFLYAIIGLYLVTPILRAFVRGASRRDFHWFFLLVFLFTSLLPTLRYLFPEQMAPVSTWFELFNIKLILGYVGYYIAGYYLKNFTLGRLAEFIIYILGILGAAVTVFGTLTLSARNGALCHLFFEYNSPNVALMAVAVFVLFRYMLGVSDERSRRQRLSGAARVSFGIYLVHEFFIILLRHLDITTLSFNPILAVPVLSAAVFLCAFAVAWLISKIPLVGRFLT